MRRHALVFSLMTLLAMCLGFVLGQASDDRDRVVELWRFDTNGDGRIDHDEVRVDDEVIFDVTDTNGDGLNDRWTSYVGGKRDVAMKDDNDDGKVDSWWYRTGAKTGLLRKDLDFDGSVDTESETFTVRRFAAPQSDGERHPASHP